MKNYNFASPQCLLSCIYSLISDLDCQFSNIFLQVWFCIFFSIKDMKSVCSEPAKIIHHSNPCPLSPFLVEESQLEDTSFGSTFNGGWTQPVFALPIASLSFYLCSAFLSSFNSLIFSDTFPLRTSVS